MTDETISENVLVELASKGWEIVDGTLQATFETGTWALGMGLLNAISETAESANHHPDVVITYPRLEVRLISHDIGAITERDKSLATAISELAKAQGLGSALKP